MAKKFIDKKRGRVSRFSVKISLSPYAENYHMGIIYFFIDFGYRKILGIKEGQEPPFFRRWLFTSQCRNFSQGNTSVFGKTLGIEIFYA